MTGTTKAWIVTDAEAAATAAIDRFGRIDVLVNNAANFYAGFFEEISDAQVRAQLETNLFGPMNVTRAILPVMRKQRSGHVITITSLAGVTGLEFVAAYATSKFALEGWMECLRFHVEPYGIHPTTVEPGCFRTDPLVEGASTIWPELSIEDYAERTAAANPAWRTMNGQQPGDPAKLAQASSRLPASPSLPCAGSPEPMQSPRSNRKPTTSSHKSMPTVNSRRRSRTTTPRKRPPIQIRQGHFMPDNTHETPMQRMIGGFAPKFVSLTDDLLFGDIWARPELSPRDRSLITVAGLISGGNSEQLEGHLALAKTNGLTETELKEVIIHMAFYAGWPKAVSAMTIAKRVFGE
jgi:NAD(P)-dependent dehydrogenase (short-subunit alcohol dehydrogenase family)/alkylhydroperoxidase/carboxymuconolactone decarboxylase family protein YurZ